MDLTKLTSEELMTMVRAHGLVPTPAPALVPEVMAEAEVIPFHVKRAPTPTPFQDLFMEKGWGWHAQEVDLTTPRGERFAARGLIRSDNGDPLGIVTDRYALVQPLEIAAELDRCLGHHKLGKITLMPRCAADLIVKVDVGEMSPPTLADPHRLSVVVRAVFDGTGGISIGAMMTRLVCGNGARTNIGEVTKSSVRHIGRAKERLTIAAETVGEAHKGATRYMTAMNQMLAKPLGVLPSVTETVVSILSDGQFTPKSASAVMMGKAETIMSLAANGDGARMGAGTLYSLFQGFTAYSSHESPVRGSNKDAMRAFRVAAGDPMVARAFDTLSAMAV